jgi:hypothetical protein
MDQTGTLFHPDFRILAPTIVAATVIENRVVATLPAKRLPDVILDLHEVRSKKEVVFRGEVAEEFTFYYFVPNRELSAPNPHYKSMFAAEPKRQYVFFLGNENGVLRSIGDVGAYSLRVRTGMHPNFHMPASNGATEPSVVANAIADLVLTIGDEPDLPGLAYDLLSVPSLLDRWGSRLHTFLLVRKLLIQPEPVRSAACALLAESYVADETCLHEIRDDIKTPSEIRQRMEELLTSFRHAPEDTLKKLKDSGGLALPGRVQPPDSRKELLDELRILLYDSYPPLREEACAAIQRHFPGEECMAGK